MNARALILTTIAVVVCSAILSGIGVIVFDHFTSEDPLPDVLAGSLVFGTLSFVVLAIAARSSFRAYRGEAGGGPAVWVAYAVPALALVGVGSGIWFMARVSADHQRYAIETAQGTCATLGARVPGGPASDPAACVPIALRCNRVLREGPEARMGRGMRGIDAIEPDLRDLSPRDAALVRCLRAGPRTRR